MSASNRPESDYDETTRTDADPYDDTGDPYGDTDDAAYASESDTWAWGWGMLPFYSTDTGVADRDETAYDDYGENEGSWVDEGIISILVIAGFVLFIIPEPATTGLGILLMLAGAGLWIVDLMT